MKDGKPQNGYDRLLIKYKALEVKNAELQATVEQQATTISKLNVELHNLGVESIKEKQAHESLVYELFEHMGWFRRLLWWFDHPRKEGGK